VVVSKTPYTSPSCRTGILEAHLRFGRGGELIARGVWYHPAD
jgi:hypothetical protein